MSAHGSRGTYQSGCRCLLCRLANARYRAPAPQPKADAIPAQAHLQQLETEQIGVRQASRLSGLSPSYLRKIRKGILPMLPAKTVAAILAIPAVPAAGALVNAWQTKRLLRALKDEDFTPTTLAKRLQIPSLQRKTPKRVRQKTARRVAAFYKQQMSED